MSRSVSWLRSHPLSLRPYQRAHWSRLVGHFETHLEGGPSAFGYEAPMGSGKTTTVKAIAAALLSEGKARLVVIAAPLDAIVQAWAVRGAWSHEPGGYLQLPSPPQDFGDLPRPSTVQLSDPRWWASATGCWVTTRQAMCTSAAREAMEKSHVSLRDVLAVGDEGHHHGDGTEAGKFFAALRRRGAATLLVSGTPWHGSGSIFTSDTQVVRLSAAAYAQEIDPSTGHAYAPSQWRVERYLVPEVVTDDIRLAYEPDRPTSDAATWIKRDVRGMCRAAAERWAAIGCPRTVVNVPGAKLWKTCIVDELQRVAPAVLGRPAVVVNLIGNMTNEDRAAAQARLAADGAAGAYDHPERVDVVVSCARMDEGTDWPPCSHVFNIRIPSSPLRILQRWARASRGKRKITGYPAAWVDTQTMVFFVPTLTGDDARERAYKQHREQAVLLAAYLADYEAASRWIDPRCFAAQDAAARRAEGRKLPKGARLAYAANGTAGDGDRRGGTAIERARATAEIVKRIQKRGPDGAVKIAELDAELAKVMPDVSAVARKAAMLSLYRTGEVADAVTAALGRANRATAEGRPALRVREELQIELDAIVEKFGHFDVSVPDELNVCAAKFTALEADSIVECVRQSSAPPWHDIRDDREALEAFTRERVATRGSRPFAGSGACESLNGKTWAALEQALRAVESSIPKAIGYAVPPWDYCRDNKNALEAFARKCAKVRSDRPTAASGKCKSLDGWTWAGIDRALRKVESSLAQALGQKAPWHKLRDDRESLEIFAQVRTSVRGERPSSSSGSCDSLGGWSWAGLDDALRQQGSCLADALGRRQSPNQGYARKIRAWYDEHGWWPRKQSANPIEAQLGRRLCDLRNRAPECLAFEDIPLRANRAEITRKREGKHQYTQLAEVIVLLARNWRVVVASKCLGTETGARIDSALRCAHSRPGKSRGLGHTPDLCQANSIATANAEIEAGCWRFTQAGADEPDRRGWAELLASGDHVHIERAERVAFLDWKDSHLRGGTCWTDPRNGPPRKWCPPAVRRPWTPPAPAESADGT